MPRRRRTDSHAKRDPIKDAIALRAYELYLERGRIDGHALEDWLRAERELAEAAVAPLIDRSGKPPRRKDQT
jgi:hypothetical protein